MFHHQEEH
jgi:hypothetical protein